MPGPPRRPLERHRPGDRPETGWSSSRRSRAPRRGHPTADRTATVLARDTSRGSVHSDAARTVADAAGRGSRSDPPPATEQSAAAPRRASRPASPQSRRPGPMPTVDVGPSGDRLRRPVMRPRSAAGRADPVIGASGRRRALAYDGRTRCRASVPGPSRGTSVEGRSCRRYPEVFDEKFATVGLDLRRCAAAAGRVRPGTQRGRHQHLAVPQHPAPGAAGLQRDGHRHRVPDGDLDGPRGRPRRAAPQPVDRGPGVPGRRSSSGPRPGWSPTR